MTAPYRVGEAAVWLALDDAGMRVYRAAVMEVHREGDRWSVETSRGVELVDEHGEGRSLVPLDQDIAEELEQRGDGYVVRSTVEELERDLDPTLDWRRFEQDLDRDTDQDRWHER